MEYHITHHITVTDNLASYNAENFPSSTLTVLVG